MSLRNARCNDKELVRIGKEYLSICGEILSVYRNLPKKNEEYDLKTETQFSVKIEKRTSPYGGPQLYRQAKALLWRILYVELSELQTSVFGQNH